ncbi:MULTISPECIES: hypothetical protein [Spirulina sp. CCY15215]|uniref:hypothetical protein n=1 Tax=Spirulina sp. CCY15215 TaxID=2767591 RepID=UPI0019517129|nr:hypothetical protein [Spirulina major]
MDQRDLRKWHRLIAPIIFLPLFVTAATGVIWVARSWFGVSVQQPQRKAMGIEGETLI